MNVKKVWTAYGGASVVTANFGATPFAYTPPTGYLAWDTSTTIATPNNGTYNGTFQWLEMPDIIRKHESQCSVTEG